MCVERRLLVSRFSPLKRSHFVPSIWIGSGASPPSYTTRVSEAADTRKTRKGKSCKHYAFFVTFVVSRSRSK